MLKKSINSWSMVCCAMASSLCISLVTTPSQAAIYKSDTVKFYGDFRTRIEADFDSQNSSGAERDDRERLRIRARLGFNYTPDETWDFGMRIRSGSDDSQQSPHITILDFSNNDTGDADFNFDKWFLKGKAKDASFWVGRNSLQYWKQNELFWDDDVTPAGIGANYKMPISDGTKIEFNAGYFSLPVGMKAFSGQMGEAQVVLHGDNFTIAGGVLNMDADGNDPDSAGLLSGNGARDYRLWIVSGQFRLNVADKPLKIGADIMSNSKDYDATEANRDETDGFDVFVHWGSTKPQQWLLGYYYANIEALAVNSSFAQDDWVRWGSATQTRGSDMKGSEFRVAYGLSNKQNVVARLYIVESIQTIEDGNRLRVDWNVKF